MRAYLLCRSVWHIAAGDAPPLCDLPAAEIVMRTTDLVFVERAMRGDSYQRWCAQCDRLIATAHP